MLIVLGPLPLDRAKGTLNACMRKLVVLLNAMLRTNTAWRVA